MHERMYTRDSGSVQVLQYHLLTGVCCELLGACSIQADTLKNKKNAT